MHECDLSFDHILIDCIKAANIKGTQPAYFLEPDSACILKPTVCGNPQSVRFKLIIHN